MRRRQNVIIELTPLLDVIMIMLFLIMTRSSDAAAKQMEQADKDVKTYEQQAEEAKAENEILVTENAELKGKLASIESFEEFATIISVTVVMGEGGERTIVVNCGDKDEYISYNWDNTRFGENSLKATLNKLTNGEGPKFISFTYDETKIYNVDYEMISSVTADLMGDEIYISIDSENKPGR